MSAELIGKEVPANLYRGLEAVGGKLLFQEDRMIFQSHKFNMQTGSTEMMYCNIGNIKKRNTLGLVPNGLLITMKDGIEYKLVVNGRNRIIEFLDSYQK